MTGKDNFIKIAPKVKNSIKKGFIPFISFANDDQIVLRFLGSPSDSEINFELFKTEPAGTVFVASNANTSIKKVAEDNSSIFSLSSEKLIFTYLE